jgi:hypothetical protein
MGAGKLGDWEDVGTDELRDGDDLGASELGKRDDMGTSELGDGWKWAPVSSGTRSMLAPASLTGAAMTCAATRWGWVTKRRWGSGQRKKKGNIKKLEEKKTLQLIFSSICIPNSTLTNGAHLLTRY